MNTTETRKQGLQFFDKVIQGFYNLIVKSQLNCPKEVYWLTIVSFWAGFFQISSMLISFTSNDNTLQPDKIYWYEGWKLFIFFTRPVQFIYQEYNEHNQAINISIIIILFAYLGVHIVIAIVCSFLIESSTKKKKKVGFQILNIFVNCSIYFNSLFCIVVIETTLLLAFQGSVINSNNISKQSEDSSSKTSSSNSSQITPTEKYFNNICGYTLFVLYQLYSFMNSKFYEISYSLDERGMQKYCQDNLSIFINHIRIGVVVGYTMDPKGENKGPVVVAIFCSLYFILLIYEYFMKKPFSSILKSDNYLAALASNFLFTILMILNKVAQVSSSSKSITLILLLIPITVKLCLDVIHKINDQHLFANLLDENEFNSDNDELISRKISMLYNNRDLILSQDQLKLFGVYEQHKLNCKRQMCFCQHNFTKCNEGTVFLLNCDILNRYIRYLIKVELIHSNLNEKIERLVYFIRYKYLIFKQFSNLE